MGRVCVHARVFVPPPSSQAAANGKEEFQSFIFTCTEPMLPGSIPLAHFLGMPEGEAHHSEGSRMGFARKACPLGWDATSINSLASQERPTVRVTSHSMGIAAPFRLFEFCKPEVGWGGTRLHPEPHMWLNYEPLPSL